MRFLKSLTDFKSGDFPRRARVGLLDRAALTTVIWGLNALFFPGSQVGGVCGHPAGREVNSDLWFLPSWTLTYMSSYSHAWTT
jgi:hypothetical protein